MGVGLVPDFKTYGKSFEELDEQEVLSPEKEEEKVEPEKTQE